MLSQIIYEGSFDKDNLAKWVSRPTVNAKWMTANNGRPYTPEQDLRILNLALWFNIHNGSLREQVHGNKFYPEPWENGVRLRRSRPLNTPVDIPSQCEVCILCKGFFMSVRPCIKAIGIDINPTTTAFFPDLIVSDWVKAKLGYSATLRRSPAILPELKGLRVHFKYDKKPMKGGSSRLLELRL
jgi:hypothetical protein